MENPYSPNGNTEFTSIQENTPPATPMLSVQTEQGLKKRESIYLWVTYNLQGACLLLWDYLPLFLILAVIKIVYTLTSVDLRQWMNDYNLQFIYLLLANGLSFVLLFVVRKIKLKSLLKNNPEKLKKFMKFTTIFGAFIIVFGLNSLMGVFSSLLSSLIPGGENSVSSFVYSVDSAFIDKVLYVVTIIIVAPIGEELVYRGGLLMPLRRYGDGFAILISGFIFGLGHGNLSQIPGAMVMGFFWGFLACKTDSILPGMILHFLNNTVVVFSQIASANIEVATGTTTLYNVSYAYNMVVNLFSLISLAVVVILILVMLFKLVQKNFYIFGFDYRLENLYEIKQKYMPKRFLLLIVSPVLMYVLYMDVQTFLASFG